MDDYKPDDTDPAQRLNELNAEHGIGSTFENPSMAIDEDEMPFFGKDDLPENIKSEVYPILDSSLTEPFTFITQANEFIDHFCLPCIYFIGLHSDLLSNFIPQCYPKMNPLFLHFIARVIEPSGQIIEEALKNGIVQLSLCYVASRNQELIHSAFKVIRRIFKLSHIGRVIYYGLDFFTTLAKMFMELSPENKVYISKTLLYYAILDPVYGTYGYEKNSTILHPRKAVVEIVLEFFSDNRTFFKTQHFLKYGNTIKMNSPLWFLFDLFMKSEEPRIQIPGIAGVGTLAQIIPGAADVAVSQTCIFKIAPIALSNPNPYVRMAMFSALSTLLFACDFDDIVKKFQHSTYLVDAALDNLRGEDPIPKVSAARLINNLCAVIHGFVPLFLDRDCFKILMEQLADGEYALRTELLWAFTTIVAHADEDIRASIITSEFLDAVADFTESADTQLKEAVLNMLCLLIDDHGRDFTNILAESEMLRVIEDIHDEIEEPLFFGMTQFIIDCMESEEED